MTDTVVENKTLAEELQALIKQRDSDQKILRQAQEARDNAKATRINTGKYADPVWFAKTNNTIRERTLSIHECSRKIKELKVKMKKDYFNEAAKQILTKTEYNKVVELADKLTNTKETA